MIERGDEILGSERRRVRSAILVLSLAFRAAPLRATILLVVTLASALSAAIAALALRVVVDAIAREDVEVIPVAVAAMVVIGVLSSLTSLASFILRERVVDETRLLLDLRLIELSTQLPGIEHHERAAYADQMERIRERRGQLAGSVSSIVAAATTIAALIGTVGALATVHPVLVLLPLFGIPSFFLNGRGERLLRGVWEHNTETYRSMNHLFKLSSTAEPGKEVRIFGLADELQRRHDERWGFVERATNRASRQYALMSTAGWAVFATGFVLMLLFVVRRVLDGEGSPGDIALLLTLGSQVNEVVGGLVSTLQWAMQSLDVVRRYLWLQDYGDRAREVIASPAPVPDRLTSGITLDGVGFRYPDTETDVLDRVDLHLPAGSTIAIVGDNGAGKSTLVKLLCRFYEPTRGRILVDGVPLADIPTDEWRLATAAGFQDFARYELLARESVGVGDLPRMAEVPAVEAALERGSATDVIALLTEGLETQLGKTFTEGTELSGGQWQKLALGRAMMRTSPLLLVLDEPTAAIDAETEHALFERFTGAAQEAAARTGAITVLVSHRFSTVRMADLIVVVDGGGIVEHGSHGELMQRGGLYAELYELQASSYR